LKIILVLGRVGLVRADVGRIEMTESLPM